MSSRKEVELDQVPSMNNPAMRNKLLTTKIDSALENKSEYLKEFSQMSIPECPSFLSLLLFPVLFAKSPRLGAVMAKLEGPEGIATLLYQLQHSRANEEESKEEAEKLIDALLSMYINSGVIAALILGIVYPTLLTPIEYSGQSIDFFGRDVVAIFFYIYYSMITLALVLALSLLFDSVQFYKHLGFWATSLEAKVAYAKKGGVLYTVSKSIAMVFVFAGAIPFGVCSMVSPVGAAICLVGGVCVVLLASASMTYEKHMLNVLHMWASTFFKNQGDGTSYE